MKFKTKNKKENGFWVENPTPEIEKLLLNNGWKETRNLNVAKLFNLPRIFELKGSSLFCMWSQSEFIKVKSYLGEYFDKIEENVILI